VTTSSRNCAEIGLLRYRKGIREAMAKRQRSHDLKKFMPAVLALGLLACTPQVSENPTTEVPTPSPTSPAPTPEEPPTPTPSPSTEPTEEPTEAAQLSVYWLQSAEEKLALTPSKITPKQPTDTPEEQLKVALERLLQGPANADVASGIPEGTQLNTLTVKEDGVHIDVSKEFTTGGGSAAMQGRLGQLIYTVSSLNPEEPVWISIDGEPLTVLGGEGLVVSQPMTRQEFQTEFSL
jgi:spore germination protein GerM